MYEHKQKTIEGFTSKYNITMLVYYESTDDVRQAIAREKQIKGWLRSKKIELIESTNPGLGRSKQGLVWRFFASLRMTKEKVSF